MLPRYSIEQLAATFNRLLELPESARAQWLSRNNVHPDDAKRLKAMLHADADADAGFLDEQVLLHAQALRSEQDLDIEPTGLIGKQFGSFRLIRLLGQGGMATVFLAERIDADFKQTVAVKLLKRGLFSSIEQKLFRRERRLLAQLSHPNIAHLIDGGITDAGISYLVIEYVDGVRLDEYARSHRLDLDARLKLFKAICEAVEAAHQAFIVHRDIKPSNILVTQEGIPKLLDFGIAKLLLDDSIGDSAHHTFTAALTPNYAAPEQLTGSPVTTATDVYALGVVLHELLTGNRPDESGSVLASRSINIAASPGSDVLPLSQPLLKRRLQGDLDNIIARSLSPEPENRYPTVAALLEDIERYSQGRPVHAHPRSRWYVARKFFQRHRAIVVLTTLFSLAVLASLGFAIRYAENARIEAQRANVVRDFLLDLLDTAKAELPPDQQPTPAALAKKAAERLAKDQALPELTRSELLHTLGKVSATSGAYDQAARLFELAIAIKSRELGHEHPDVWATKVELASVRKDQGRISDTRKIIESILPLLQRHDDKSQVPALELMGIVEMRSGNMEKAIAYQRRSTGMALRFFDSDSYEACLSRLGPGNLLIAADHWQEGINELESALDIWRKAGLPLEHAQYSASISNLAVAYHAMGDYEKALPLFRQSLESRQKTLPENHPSLANSTASLGMLLAGMMRFDEAEAYLLKSLEMSRQAYGDAHLEVVLHLSQLASVEIRRNRSDVATRYAKEAVEICEKQKWTSTSDCSYATIMLGSALRNADGQQSLHYLDLAVKQYQDRLEAPHPLIATAISKRALTLLSLNRHDEALADINSAIAMFNAAKSSTSTEALIALETKALILHRLGRNTDALASIDQALPIWKDKFGARKDRLALMLETRARIQNALENKSAAGASAREALSLKVEESIFPGETITRLKKIASQN